MRRRENVLFCALSCVCFFIGSISAEDAASLDQLLKQAASAEAADDFKTAKAHYQKTTEAHPKSAEAWAAYGEHLRFYAHDEAAAILAFRNALSAEKQSAHASAFAWRGLGAIECTAGRDAIAIEYFNKSLAASALPDTHRSLCHLYSRQRKFKEAAHHAGEAVKLNPDDAIARLLYAAQLFRAGETQKAQAEYDTATEQSGLKTLKPIHCCIIYNAAGYLSVTGQHQPALSMLKRFFETPNHRHLTREEIETDADFDTLKTLPEFQKLMDAKFKDVPAPRK